MGRSRAITELVAPLHRNKFTRALIKPILDTSHELAGPSPQPSRWAPDIECPEMTVEQIHEIVEAFAKIAKLCKEVWVDGVTMPVVDSLGEEFLAYVKDGMTFTVKADGTVEVE